MPLARLADRLSAAVGRLCAGLILAMTAAGAAAAVLRYLARPLGLDPSLNALADAQWMLFSAVFLLGAGWALSTDAHVRVDVLYGRLGPRRRAWTDLLGTVLLLLPFCGLLLWATTPAVAGAVAIREGALDPGGLARWPVRLLVPVGVVLLAVQGVAQALKAVAVLRGRPAPPPAASGPGL